MDTNDINLYESMYEAEDNFAGQAVYAEALNQSENSQIMGCNDCIMHNVGDMNLANLGRVVNVRFTLRNICPGRRVAVGLILYELGLGGVETPRGFKVVTVPAHNSQRCRDVAVRNVLFLLPEENVGSVCGCGTRRFFVRHTHHYLDFPGGCFTESDPIMECGCNG